PKTRRFVHRRDHGKCTVPGCRASRFIDVHHIVPRYAGGAHSADNLTLLCDGHHRALHDGKLTITGKAPHFVVSWAAPRVATSSASSPSPTRSSLSPSPSVSPSLSASPPAALPSASLSVSASPSAALPSASLSVSASPSLPSASLSVSA